MVLSPIREASSGSRGGQHHMARPQTNTSNRVLNEQGARNRSRSPISVEENFPRPQSPLDMMGIGLIHHPDKAVEQVEHPPTHKLSDHVMQNMRVKEITNALHEVESVGSSVNVFQIDGGKMFPDDEPNRTGRPKRSDLELAAMRRRGLGTAG
ncbi:unnamed protein product, partial [Amoebophrya sp. A120]|eukprot:GSA120T00009209001.1